MIAAGQQLLAEYATTGSEEAFRGVVDRYINLVFSTALRLVNGDSHCAQDVTQKVFADLASMAPKLSADVMLGGWLHRHTCFVASKTLRAERRRLAREKAAMEINQTEQDSSLGAITPVLDDAINRLKPEDRQAILLRYFEQRDFQSVGELLGSNEDAARKRVHRAIEKLRSLLARRGVTLSAAALGTVLGTHAVNAAPIGLAAAITTAAVATAAAGGSTTLTILNLVTMTKTQAGVLAAITVALTVPLVLTQQAKAKLRHENQALRAQVQSIDALALENERLSNLLARASAPAPAPARDDQFRELMKLRGEVGVLRKTAAEAANAPQLPKESPLSGVTQNPEMWNALREQQKMGLSMAYEGFAKRSGLPKEKIDQFNDLMADHVMTNIHHVTEVLRDGKSPQEMEQIFALQEAELKNKVRALAGEEGLQKFTDYNRDMLSYLTSVQYQSMLPGEKKDKEQLQQQLFALMKQESQNVLAGAGLSPDYQMVPTLNFRNFASDQTAERNLQLMDSIYAQVEAQAGSFLSAEQLQKFADFRKLALNNNRVALAMNRKLMAPPGN